MKKAVPTIKMTRIVGYMRPIHLWNAGKKKEWSKRNLIVSTQSVGVNKA